MKRAASIRIFLADGTPDGVKLVEKSNWTGRAIACSRTDFPRVKKRTEFNRTGVYILLGFDDEQQVPIVYIGEGDPILPRLEAHEKNKDFWETLIAFSSKDENLNKAHIQYLESRLVELAHSANRCKLSNGTAPSKPALSEADTAEMEHFLAEMHLVFSVVGVKIFDKANATAADHEDRNEKLQIKSGNSLLGIGYDRPEGFIVAAGSKCLEKEAPSIGKGLKALRASLLNRGVIKTVGDYYEFAIDYSFNSPSQAAGVMLGRSSNGRTEWKTESGKSLKQIQNEENS